VLTVVKVGGSLLRNPAALADVAGSASAFSGRTVWVHGGGPEISRWQERLNLPVTWREGLRVTTPEAMQVTSMVLSGWVNKRLVSALLDVGQPAVGISGEDGGLLQAVRKDGGRLGEVGEISDVNETILRVLLSAGIVPVVSPVSRGPGGTPLNVNADEAAIAVAAAFTADRLLLVSDVPGVLVDGVVVPRLDATEVRELLDGDAVTGGMMVKVRQALLAAGAGVEVRIGDEGILRDDKAGTAIVGGVRKAEATP
jgi:acetylglutamate kinase